MPWCPNCKDEYREGFTKCADCDVDLVDELPIEEEQHDEKPEIALLEKPVVLETFANDIEFMYVASLLDDMDIPYRVQTRGESTVKGLPTGNVGVHKTIYVDDKDYDRAEEVLESLDAYLMEDYDEEDQDDDWNEE